MSKVDRMITALIKIDRYYASKESKIVDESERNDAVRRIAKNFNVVVHPITNEEFAAYYPNHEEYKKSGKVAAGCVGQDYTLEGVLEGNGCVGLVKRYSDGSVSLTRYCNGHLDSYDCYPGSPESPQTPNP